MAYCTNCGKPMDDHDTFCTNCGARAFNVQTGYVSEYRTLYSILSYLGLLALIPFLAEKRDDFVNFHSRQGINLLCLGLCVYVITSIAGSIFAFPPMTPLLVIITISSGAFSLFVFILQIVGIVAAYNNERKLLPIVNSIDFAKLIFNR